MPSQRDRDNSERRHQNHASERRPQNLPPPVCPWTFEFDNCYLFDFH